MLRAATLPVPQRSFEEPSRRATWNPTQQRIEHITQHEDEDAEKIGKSRTTDDTKPSSRPSIDENSSPRRRKRKLPRYLRAWFDRYENDELRSGRSAAWLRRHGQKHTVVSQMRATLFGSWFNLLLIFVPAGFAVRYIMGYSLTTFLVNFFAIIPLGYLAEYAIAELILYIGDNWGGLAYITISNFVQIVSSIFLLKSRQLDVLHSNLVGGILSSILLVLGFSIFFGGINRLEQHFNLTVAHLSANLLSLAATSLLIPTASHLLLQTPDAHITRQSRGASFILLLVYTASLIFQFYSHVETWGKPNQKAKKRNKHIEGADVVRRYAAIGALGAATLGGISNERNVMQEPADEEEKIIPQLSHWFMVVYLVVVVTIMAFCTDFAVQSIDALSSKANLSKPFIGLILLPLLNNDLTPIKHAVKDNMHQTMNFTIGKCLQTSLFVTPLMVLIGWGMKVDFTLNFDGFEVVSLFASVLLLNYLIIDGKSSWIQGVLLTADWALIALAAFYAT